MKNDGGRAVADATGVVREPDQHEQRQFATCRYRMLRAESGRSRVCLRKGRSARLLVARANPTHTKDQKAFVDLGLFTVHLPGEDDPGNKSRPIDNTRLWFWDADKVLKNALTLRLAIAIDLEIHPNSTPILLRFVIRSAPHGDIVMEHGAVITGA